MLGWGRLFPPARREVGPIFKLLATWIVSWSSALAILCLRYTCRIRVHQDPRASLRESGQPYIYAVLHAHQVAAIMDSEPGTGAMVSRSADGQIIVPILRLSGCVPVRGSSGKHGQDKGGRAALDALVEHVTAGRPGYLAVDGPRGPRGRVHKGVALLARRTGAAVVTIVPIPSRRWILSRSWDRLQIPKPFARIDGYCGAPLTMRPEESLDEFARRIEQTLGDLEQKHVPGEAKYSQAKYTRHTSTPSAQARKSTDKKDAA